MKVKDFLLFDADPAVGLDSRGRVHNPNFPNKKMRATSKSESKKVPNILSYDGFLKPIIPYHTARNPVFLLIYLSIEGIIIKNKIPSVNCVPFLGGVRPL